MAAVFVNVPPDAVGSYDTVVVFGYAAGYRIQHFFINFPDFFRQLRHFLYKFKVLADADQQFVGLFHGHSRSRRHDQSAVQIFFHLLERHNHLVERIFIIGSGKVFALNKLDQLGQFDVAQDGNFGSGSWRGRKNNFAAGRRYRRRRGIVIGGQRFGAVVKIHVQLTLKKAERNYERRRFAVCNVNRPAGIVLYSHVFYSSINNLKKCIRKGNRICIRLPVSCPLQGRVFCLCGIVSAFKALFRLCGIF